MSKSKQKNDVKPDLGFQASTAAADFGYWLIEKACFSFLAVTTGIMTFNSFQGMIKQNVPPQYYYIAVGIVVMGIYLIIDHNLSENFKDYWRNKSNAHDYQNANYVKKFLDYTALFIILRFALTITASWWSAGEVADLTTVKPDATELLQEIAKHDEYKNQDKSQAFNEMNTLRSSEEMRVAEAKRRGNKLIAEKVADGSIHQTDMWKRNPTFFDAISPTSKYYTQNKAFADKVHAAQAQAQQWLDEEYAKTKQAEALYYGVTADTTGNLLSNSIAGTIGSDNQAYLTKLNRRTNFVLRLDIVCALIGFLVMRIRYLRRRAGGEAELDKTFSFIIAKAIRKQNIQLLEWMEDRLNIDLDGNGHVGSVGSHPTAATPSASAAVPDNPYTKSESPDRRPIGFYKDAEMKFPSPIEPRKVERAPAEPALSWEQENDKKAFNVVQRALNVKPDGTKIVDARYFKSRMKQTWQRSIEYETDDARHYQWCLYKYFRSELEELGWQITELGDQTLNIIEL